MSSGAAGRYAADRSTSRARIAIVGPTHPYKGGVAAHTTALAHELDRVGHRVALVSWRHLYPSLLYPGVQRLPGDLPDTRPYAGTTRPLSWARPDTWWRVGRQLRKADVLVIVHVVPHIVPAHLAVLRAARRRGKKPTVVAVVHNVLPHEKRPGSELLMRRFFAAVDAVVVHSQEQARLAAGLGASRVEAVQLPPHLPGKPRLPRPRRAGRVRLLALGIVREYKGLDAVLEALREVPDVYLTIAGEFWGEAGERVRSLAADPNLADRVLLQPGYVPADRIASLLAEHDVLVLAYRSATGSQNVLLAHHHGLPVIVTRVGTLADGVEDGVDGLVIAPHDHTALVQAMRQVADREALDRLSSGVCTPDLAGPWRRYVATLEALTDLAMGEER